MNKRDLRIRYIDFWGRFDYKTDFIYNTLS